VKVTVEEVETT